MSYGYPLKRISDLAIEANGCDLVQVTGRLVHDVTEAETNTGYIEDYSGTARVSVDLSLIDVMTISNLLKQGGNVHAFGALCPLQGVDSGIGTGRVARPLLFKVHILNLAAELSELDAVLQMRATVNSWARGST